MNFFPKQQESRPHYRASRQLDQCPQCPRNQAQINSKQLGECCSILSDLLQSITSQPLDNNCPAKSKWILLDQNLDYYTGLLFRPC